MNPALADWHTSERDGRVLEQLGVRRILQFPAVGLDFWCVSSMGLYVLGLRGLNAVGSNAWN